MHTLTRSHADPQQNPAAAPQPNLTESYAMHKRPSVAGIVWPIIIVAVIFLSVERFAPSPFKPSTVAGVAAGNIEYHASKEALEAERAKVAALTEEQSRLQREVIAAQAEGERIKAAAQSQAQQEVEAMKAKAQIAVGAYQMLYARTDKIWSALLDMSRENASMRNNMVASQQGGRTGSVALLDMVGAFAAATGNTDLADRLAMQRKSMANASIDEVEHVMARTIPTPQMGQFAMGLPDIAALQASISGDTLQPDVKPAPPVLVQPRQAPPPALYR